MIDWRFILWTRGEAKKVGRTDANVAKAKRKERDMATKSRNCVDGRPGLSRTGLEFSKPMASVIKYALHYI